MRARCRADTKEHAVFDFQDGDGGGAGSGRGQPGCQGRSGHHRLQHDLHQREHAADGSDTDIKYFWGAGTLGDLTPGGDGTGAPDYTYATLPGLLGSNTHNGTGSITPNVPLTTGSPVSWLLLGADPAGVGTHQCGTQYHPQTCYDYDKFKISGITLNTPSGDVPVPEPTSLLLLGTGLVGLGGRMRRYFS